MEIIATDIELSDNTKNDNTFNVYFDSVNKVFRAIENDVDTYMQRVFIYGLTKSVEDLTIDDRLDIIEYCFASRNEDEDVTLKDVFLHGGFIKLLNSIGKPFPKKDIVAFIHSKAHIFSKDELTKEVQKTLLDLIDYPIDNINQISFWNKVNDELISMRMTALEWWNNLSSLKKTQLCDTNTNLLGAVRRWESITGREIEILYYPEN